MPDDPTPSQVLFISHTATDRPYALALKQALHQLVGETAIDVRYSTSAETGPQGGDQWRQWIDRQVVEGRTALIIVTPESVSKPWLLWEAGACRGAWLAQRKAAALATPPGDPPPRLLVSVAFGLSETECPDPLRGDQIVAGTDGERMKQLFFQVLENHETPSGDLFKAGERMQGVIDRYLEAVRTALLKSPSLVTEPNIQDWLARLETLVEEEDRGSELRGFERWMKLAFGREGETARVPIDVRLHRRLGELYLRRRRFAAAVSQLELARRSAPRDIYVLRPLGEALIKHYLELEGEQEAAGELRGEIAGVLAAIQDLDEEAFVANPDAAAQYGKYQRLALGDLEGAIRTFATALHHNPDSYYLADVLGQALLEAERVDEARETYRRAIEILERLDESNVWTWATLATARIVLGDRERAIHSLAAVAAEDPPPAVTKAVADAVRRVCGYLGLSSGEVRDLLRSLEGEATAERVLPDAAADTPGE